MLSVSAAAREAGTKLSIIAGEQRITFEELSRQVQRLSEKINQIATAGNQPIAFVATPTLDSLLLLYALLELRRTALPLKSTAALLRSRSND